MNQMDVTNGFMHQTAGRYSRHYIQHHTHIKSKTTFYMLQEYRRHFKAQTRVTVADQRCLAWRGRYGWNYRPIHFITWSL